MDSDDTERLKELFCRFIDNSGYFISIIFRDKKELCKVLEDLESKLDHIVDKNRVLTERIEKLEKKD